LISYFLRTIAVLCNKLSTLDNNAEISYCDYLRKFIFSVRHYLFNGQIIEGEIALAV